MGFKCGIVGLPNVGKSTLFNALTRTAAAQAANYPFCTIEPNTGEVAVPDKRLDAIAAIAKPVQIVPTKINFVDIAGLVRGASKGEGLGNQFLATIREVDAIIHVLRAFEGTDVTHVEGRIDPVADAETVNTELMLADLASLERRVQPLRKRAAQADKEARAELALMDAALAELSAGRPARLAGIAPNEVAAFRGLNLMTAKPILYVANVDEASAATGNRHSERIAELARSEGAGMVVISAAIEAEVALLSDAEEHEFLASLGIEEPGLDRLIKAGYDLLGLITYFTAGPKEVRAWTITRGTRAPQAAGVIHSDFEKGFIRAQTIAYDDFIRLGGEQAAKEAGKARDEGKDYIVQDGDVMLFKFNV
jgi:GTP-binding protein YchF